MRLSSKTEYALRTLTDLAINGRDRVSRIADIASRQGIPVKFLEQILLVLKSSNMVSSQRGAKGGYFIAMQPAKITLASVVSLTDDSILASTVNEHNSNGKNQLSPFGEVWSEINDLIQQKLEKITIQDMCNRIQELQNTKGSDYFI